MSRFDYVRHPSRPNSLVNLYKEICSSGFGNEHPINWFTTLGTREDLLQMGWSIIRTTLVEGTLPATLKQMIALAVSSLNHCRYCTVAHTSALQELGLDQNVINACLAGSELEGVPPGQRPILEFSRKCAQTPAGLTDEDFELLYDNGLSEEEVMEVIMISLTTNFVNGWADAAQIAVDGSS